MRLVPVGVRLLLLAGWASLACGFQNGASHGVTSTRRRRAEEPRGLVGSLSPQPRPRRTTTLLGAEPVGPAAALAGLGVEQAMGALAPIASLLAARRTVVRRDELRREVDAKVARLDRAQAELGAASNTVALSLGATALSSIVSLRVFLASPEAPSTPTASTPSLATNTENVIPVAPVSSQEVVVRPESSDGSITAVSKASGVAVEPSTAVDGSGQEASTLLMRKDQSFMQNWREKRGGRVTPTTVDVLAVDVTPDVPSSPPPLPPSKQLPAATKPSLPMATTTVDFQGGVREETFEPIGDLTKTALAVADTVEYKEATLVDRVIVGTGLGITVLSVFSSLVTSSKMAESPDVDELPPTKRRRSYMEMLNDAIENTPAGVLSDTNGVDKQSVVVAARSYVQSLSSGKPLGTASIFPQPVGPRVPGYISTLTSVYNNDGSTNERENEIRRKIAELKGQGKIPSSSSSDGATPTAGVGAGDYRDKIRRKLGKRKSRMLGFNTGSGQEEDDDEFFLDDDDDDEDYLEPRRGRLGSLNEEGGEESVQRTVSGDAATEDINTVVAVDDEDEDMPEDELVDLVEAKIRQKRELARREREEEGRRKAKERIAAMEKADEERRTARERITALEDSRIVRSVEQPGLKKTTSGIGGAWDQNKTAEVDLYQPKTGSWGAFPRPRDISKAYGGGRRVGPGYSNEEAKLKSVEETRERLRRYREKVGIEVQSEKDHATEIEEALAIGSLAMQRGRYSTAVSSLEKVTKYCSTNSKVGGKVFLELAMAYEAVGRTKEAMAVYGTLSRSRIEEIKYNAKRLLYGLEAMKFMQEEVKSKDFSRKKASSEFIDTTGLKDFASNFDDKYNTAYIDMSSSGSFYKRLTESVVRTPREARQILLRATNAGEVDRLRIVQALRSLARRFDETLEKEIERNTVVEPVAMMDGKPILVQRKEEEKFMTSDGFELSSADQMAANLNGQWRLQLLADKKGDGVKFFNTTTCLQQLDLDEGRFSASSPLGFVTVQQDGELNFAKGNRVLTRKSVTQSGGGILSGLVDPTSGATGAVRRPHQVMIVDSVLLVTKWAPGKKGARSDDDLKEHFAVWRKMGTLDADDL